MFTIFLGSFLAHHHIYIYICSYNQIYADPWFLLTIICVLNSFPDILPTNVEIEGSNTTWPWLAKDSTCLYISIFGYCWLYPYNQPSRAINWPTMQHYWRSRAIFRHWHHIPVIVGCSHLQLLFTTVIIAISHSHPCQAPQVRAVQLSNYDMRHDFLTYQCFVQLHKSGRRQEHNALSVEMISF